MFHAQPRPLEAAGALSALRIAVVIPAYNEQLAIGRTVATMPAFVDRIIVVDDASTDTTAMRAAAAAGGRPGIEVIRHTTNGGVGAAIATGYRRALALGVDVVVVMAGDGQMDPADLPALIAPIANGVAEYSKGNRFAHRELWRTMPPLRIVGNVALSIATRVTSGYHHIFDSQCGYTAIHTRALARLDLDAMWTRYGYPNDLLARLAMIDARVVDVPVRPIYGPQWKSGIRVATVVSTFPRVLARSWIRRLAHRWRRDSPPG